MGVYSAVKRPLMDTMEATVTTVTIPGLVLPKGIFVLADDPRLFISGDDTILHLSPTDRQTTVVGNPEEEASLKDGQDIFTHFNTPDDLTVDRVGNVVVGYVRGHGYQVIWVKLH